MDYFLNLDREVKKNFPSYFKDGQYLSLLFTLTHTSFIRGENYGDLKNSNEVRVLSFLRENKDLEINTKNIIKLYAILTNDENASFKKENIQVYTGDKFYVTASKDKTPSEMEELCKNFSHLNNPSKEDFDDVFKFTLQFLCIHPFKNGNGRISNILLEFLLMKFGLEYALYLPLDAFVTGIYSSKTTLEIRKASGFYYKMKEYEYESSINHMKEMLYKSYMVLLETISKNKK